ncbi:MAG: DHH family phosphoesterase [Firmicutes bacterium]|nr:DHH family phosphoesterase [Bacillota bacterium]
MNDQIPDIRRLMREKNTFSVAGHVNPDGDGVGSCLALGMTLAALGKDVKVLLEEYNQKFDVIPGKNLLYKGDWAQLRPEAFFCMDCGAADRLGAARAVLKNAGATVCVDHHTGGTLSADYSLIDPQASSTCELVYELLAPGFGLSFDAARALYAGIVDDTGGFRHGCTGKRTHLIAAELVDKNIPFTDIYNELMERHSPTEAFVFGEALRRTRLLAGGKIALAVLSAGDMAQYGATGQDMGGIAEYLLNIRGVEISALVYEKSPGNAKASLRSKDADVAAVCRGFGGGGHVHAAGCSFEGELADAAGKIAVETERLIHG